MIKFKWELHGQKKKILALINQSLYPEIDIWHKKTQSLLLQCDKLLIVWRGEA